MVHPVHCLQRFYLIMTTFMLANNGDFLMLHSYEQIELLRKSRKTNKEKDCVTLR
jgi:hypothetical protein